MQAVNFLLKNDRSTFAFTGPQDAAVGGAPVSIDRKDVQFERLQTNIKHLLRLKLPVNGEPLNATRLAELVGRKEGYIRRLITSKDVFTPKVDVLQNLASLLNVKIDELFLPHNNFVDIIDNYTDSPNHIDEDTSLDDDELMNERGNNLLAAITIQLHEQTQLMKELKDAVQALANQQAANEPSAAKKAKPAKSRQ